MKATRSQRRMIRLKALAVTHGKQLDGYVLTGDGLERAHERGEAVGERSLVGGSAVEHSRRRDRRVSGRNGRVPGGGRVGGGVGGDTNDGLEDGLVGGEECQLGEQGGSIERLTRKKVAGRGRTVSLARPTLSNVLAQDCSMFWMADETVEPLQAGAGHQASR